MNTRKWTTSIERFRHLPSLSMVITIVGLTDNLWMRQIQFWALFQECWWEQGKNILLKYSHQFQLVYEFRYLPNWWACSSTIGKHHWWRRWWPHYFRCEETWSWICQERLIWWIAQIWVRASWFARMDRPLLSLVQCPPEDIKSTWKVSIVHQENNWLGLWFVGLPRIQWNAMGCDSRGGSFADGWDLSRITEQTRKKCVCNCNQRRSRKVLVVIGKRLHRLYCCIWCIHLNLGYIKGTSTKFNFSE